MSLVVYSLGFILLPELHTLLCGIPCLQGFSFLCRYVNSMS